MVTETRTPNLEPVTPEWMDVHSTARGAVNINDVYWKRSEKEGCPGWITIGPSAELGSDGRPLTRQAEHWIRMGRVPLVEYSYTNERYTLTNERKTIELAKDRLNTPDRWYWFFKNGGAPLFPIDQIVEHHWHITPPYGLSKSVFPQLDEWDVPEPRWCVACPGQVPPKNSDEELVTHAMVHHRMAEPQARELLAYADHPPVGAKGVAIRRKAKQAMDSTGPAPIAQPSQEPVIQSSKHICNWCGGEFPRGLNLHEKHCTSRPAGEPGVHLGQDPDASE
jgi:hypothetical protein